ncbi:MAG: hypothetical protein AAFU03_15395, partial [Bacteroidota bacterium]
VMPLMLAPVALHGLGLLYDFSWVRLVAALLSGVVWIHTFFYAVPLHNKISSQTDVMQAAQELVRLNVYRTGLWTAVFLLSWLRSAKTTSLLY